MKLRQAVPAGLLDTGSTSLATFILQAYAVRVLDADELGVYALFFAAYILANLIPQFLVLYPVEIDSVRLKRPERLRLLPASLRLMRLAPAAAIPVALIAFMLAETTSPDLRFGLALTAAAAALTAPLYEHSKRILHLSDQSWQAARMAGTQLATVVAGVGVALVLDLPHHWVPLGVLAASQLLAFLIGYRRVDTGEAAALPRIPALIRSGRWLLISGVAPAAASFGAAAIITALSSADELGFAQAAHVVGRPVLILATGLSTVIGFRLMEAGLERSHARGSRYTSVFRAAVVLAAVAYAALVGIDWFGNPLAALLPRAYEIAGLVLVAIAANLALSVVQPARSELLGARRERRVAAVDGAGAVAIVLVALMAGTLQAFALPLGILAASIVHAVGYLPARRRLYREAMVVGAREKVPRPPDALDYAG